MYWFIPLFGQVSGADVSQIRRRNLERGLAKLHQAVGNWILQVAFAIEQDPNKAPFPLPGDMDPEDLRPWITWTNDDDLIQFSPVEDTVPRWGSINPMSKYYIPNL